MRPHWLILLGLMIFFLLPTPFAGILGGDTYLIVKKTSDGNTVAFSCPAGQVLQDFNSRSGLYTCVAVGGSGTDTNWQTSWGVFDANMRSYFVPYSGATSDVDLGSFSLTVPELHSDIDHSVSVSVRDRTLADSSENVVFDWSKNPLEFYRNTHFVDKNISVDCITLLDGQPFCAKPSGGTDTNWQTSWTTFDTNMKEQYRKYTVDINTSQNINSDKNIVGSVIWSKGTSASNKVYSDIGFQLNPVQKATGGTIALVNAAGDQNVGRHYYYITYYTALGETPVWGTTPRYIDNNAAYNQVLVTLPISSDYRVIGRKIYRDGTGGTSYSDVKLVATIADNTTTTYQDNVNDINRTGSNAFFRENSTVTHFTNAGSLIMWVGTDSYEPSMGIGFLAGRNVVNGTATGGGSSTYVGTSAGQAITSGVKETLVGYGAGYNLQTGSDNTLVGHSSAYNMTGGIGNAAVGRDALYANVGGHFNAALGNYACRGATTGNSWTGNVCIGFQSGYQNTGGNYNTFAGYLAGYNISTGSYNTIIGQHVSVGSPTASGMLDIGNVLYGSGLYNAYGLSVAPQTGGKIGIDTNILTNTLTVAGDVNATQGYKVGDGNIYWDGTNLHIGQASGIAYFDKNISSTGYITRTDVYDKNQGSALDKIQDASNYLSADGKSIDHNAFSYSATTYTKGIPDGYTITYRDYAVSYCLINGKKVYEYDNNFVNLCVTENPEIKLPEEIRQEEIKIPKYKQVVEEGVDLVKEVSLIKQALYEEKVKTENLETQLCYKDVICVTKMGIEYVVNAINGK